MWAFGHNLLGIEDADAATVEAWNGDFRTEAEALEYGRALHGPDGDLIVAWVDRLTYANLMPHSRRILADMKEAIAEAGGDTTCIDNLTAHDVERLDGELKAMLQIWEEELDESPLPGEEDRVVKRSQAVHIRNRRRYPPEPAV